MSLKWEEGVKNKFKPTFFQLLSTSEVLRNLNINDKLNIPTFDKSNLFVTNALPTLSTVSNIINATAEQIEVKQQILFGLSSFINLYVLLISVWLYIFSVSSWLRILKVQQVNSWYHSVCTSCYKVASPVGNCLRCEDCKRNIAYLDKKCEFLHVFIILAQNESLNYIYFFPGSKFVFLLQMKLVPLILC